MSGCHGCTHLPEDDVQVALHVHLYSTRKILVPAGSGRTEYCNAQAPSTSDHFRRNSVRHWTGSGQAEAQQDSWASCAYLQRSKTCLLFWGTTNSLPETEHRSITILYTFPLFLSLFLSDRTFEHFQR